MVGETNREANGASHQFRIINPIYVAEIDRHLVAIFQPAAVELRKGESRAGENAKIPQHRRGLSHDIKTATRNNKLSSIEIKKISKNLDSTWRRSNSNWRGIRLLKKKK